MYHVTSELRRLMVKARKKWCEGKSKDFFGGGVE